MHNALYSRLGQDMMSLISNEVLTSTPSLKAREGKIEEAETHTHTGQLL